jgi:hypothetical protein
MRRLTPKRLKGRLSRRKNKKELNILRDELVLLY